MIALPGGTLLHPQFWGFISDLAFVLLNKKLAFSLQPLL
jgi:hypothetical protein